jgi:hypothetical protein
MNLLNDLRLQESAHRTADLHMKWLPIGEILIVSGASYALHQLTHPFFGQPIHGADFLLGIGVLIVGIAIWRWRMP